jgi:hypothetical protein
MAHYDISYHSQSLLFDEVVDKCSPPILACHNYALSVVRYALEELNDEQHDDIKDSVDERRVALLYHPCRLLLSTLEVIPLLRHISNSDTSSTTTQHLQHTHSLT